MFYLGESFILPWLPDAIKAAKDEGFEYIFMTTNGSFCKPKKVDECIATGLDSLKFLINYADEDQFVSIVQVKRVLFGDMVTNIKEARIFSMMAPMTAAFTAPTSITMASRAN